MIALAGIVHRAGSVDGGNTVTDFLPAERERGITIQSAAIKFGWKWHNSSAGDNGNDGDGDGDDEVTIQLIDTPGHVDFSVEVNRSVAVLDGAVLVVDAVAGVQAQTETVWRAMTSTKVRMNNHDNTGAHEKKNDNNGENGGHNGGRGRGHEPLPCIAFINKMDKEGCNFGQAMKTIQYKLPGANPVAMQIPLFQVGSSSTTTTTTSTSSDSGGGGEGRNKGGGRYLPGNILAVPPTDLTMNGEALANGHFVGVVDLIEMRAVIWPDVTSSSVNDVEECIPDIYNLNGNGDIQEGELGEEGQVITAARQARQDLIASLADHDEGMEEYFLLEEDPPTEELRRALRHATMKRKIVPVMAGAALKGKGVEPLLDGMADLLPSPLHRNSPVLSRHDENSNNKNHTGKGKQKKVNATTCKPALESASGSASATGSIPFGNPLHPSLLALAFKVVHMKGRGGSGDGRVVFARIYSGILKTGDNVQIMSPDVPGTENMNSRKGGQKMEKVRTERVGGMLELAGGRFDTLTGDDAICYSGEVCALVGLKSVVTGDTLLLPSNHQGSSSKGKKKKKKQNFEQDDKSSEFELTPQNACLDGVGSPKPVLTVRVEAESAEQQSALIQALHLLVVEDPSLKVEETGAVTLLSGLGELHIEVVVDRLQREYGLSVWIGKPSVAYREQVRDVIETNGLVDYDRTVGNTRMQARVHLRLEPLSSHDNHDEGDGDNCMLPMDPVVTIGSKVKKFLGFNDEISDEKLALQSDIIHALISGCKGAMKRGPNGGYEMANTQCHIIDIDAEGGVPALSALPGAIRAASATILTSTLMEQKQSCAVLEPTMSVEVSAPSDMVGAVLSDMTSRRGTIGEVVMGNNDDGTGTGGSIDVALAQSKALMHGQVPLAEILGYASTLRSITAGEGAFSAEYKGHSACDHL
eukprot:CAMPEP_0194082774 /NCGR_PEP_ID=MMETSP0149-20130528/8198_1 /TAXON_ID=122233 /ORGANISM="Chaetoceros debilis, Strain MM31A-1" /LENGTH=923 /DNA_ID=CAMNT_0038765011 /DNA_START=662 /DNA_END=3433 /DNA_ORIENTATION=-